MMDARNITAPELASALAALSKADTVESVAGTTGCDGLSMICVSDTDGGHCYIQEVIGQCGGHFYAMGYATSPRLAEAVHAFVSDHVPGTAIM